MSTQEQKVARHAQGVTGLLYTTCLAATRSARLRVTDGPDFTKRWEELAVKDAKARGLGDAGRRKEHPRAATLEDFALGAGTSRPSRGVEGELKPLKPTRRKP